MSNQNCIIYCRVSSKEQVDGTSLETQEQRCNEYAARMGWDVMHVFRERGESAKTAKRTEFIKAINLCTKKNNSINNFLVYKFDRFARNTEDHIVVRSTLQRSGTVVRSVTEPTDDTPMGRAMENIGAVFAELDNTIRAERSKAGMVARVKEGMWCWPTPLGYHKPITGKNTNIVPDLEVAPLIKIAFKEYSKGTYTYRSLAEVMAKKGLVTRYGKPPSFQTISKILHNPIYTGIIVAFGENIKGSFEPIIEEGLYNECQNIINGVKLPVRPRSFNNPVFPLRGFVRCSQCHGSITGSKSTGRKGKRYAYYHHHGTEKCDLYHSIPKITFEQMFAEYLDSLTPNEEYLELFKTVVMDIWKSNFKQFNDVNRKANNEIAKLEKERQAIFDLHRSGTYSDEDFKQQKIIIEDRLKIKRSQIQTQWSEEVNMDKAMEYCLQFVKDAAQSWLNADYETKLQLQGSTFPKGIEFDGKNCRTAKTSLIYELKETPLTEESLLVAPRGVEPLLTA